MEFDKPYYSITEAAKIFDVNASLLRYWEKEFTQLKPFKNGKGVRYFSAKDMEIIQTIYHLTRVKGYTLQGVKDELKSGAGKAMSQERAVEALQRVRARLIALSDSL